MQSASVVSLPCPSTFGEYPRRALEWCAWIALALILALWDEATTSIFLAVLVPMHLVSVRLVLGCSPEPLHPGLWTLARCMLLVPIYVAGSY